jgi:glucan 1,3-beta-glucosidase
MLAGAPRSQNGYDNSGQRTNSPQWTIGGTLSFTEGIIGQINDRYGSNPAVVGIELVNEPLMSALPGGRNAVSSYYSAAAPGISTGVVISDGFANPSSWNGFLPGATIDHHEYQVFINKQLALDGRGHVEEVYSKAAEWASGSEHTIVCGEWTAAMTDCAPALVSYSSSPPILTARHTNLGI